MNGMKKYNLFFAFVFTMSFLPGLFNEVKAQYFVEDFENVAGLTSWVIKNNSLPLGPTTWEQGIDMVFSAYSGAGYIRANFNSTNDPGNNGKISNWLISPAVVFHNGDIITFYTRKSDSATVNYADRMQVRLSLSGSSTNVGVTVNAVGDFSVLLKDINASYSNEGFPAGYPYHWKRYDLAINGLSAPTEGRFAFRYFVEFAGTTGNSDYIGIDSVAYHMPVVGIGELDLPMVFKVYPNPVKEIMYIECNTSIHTIKVSDLLGNTITELYTETGKVELNTESLRAGLYFVTSETRNGKIIRKISIVK
jgi:hypothetical protein